MTIKTGIDIILLTLLIVSNHLKIVPVKDTGLKLVKAERSVEKHALSKERSF